MSRSVYSALFLVYGTTFGAGDGTTTFNMPDMQGRYFVGLGTHADVLAIGQNEGAALANRRPKHKHTVTDPGHGHGSKQYFTDSSGGSSPDTTGGGFSRSQIPPAATGISVGPTTSGTPVDAGAYFVGNWIIKT